MRLEELPYEIHFHLLQYLDAHDLTRLCLTSHYWRNLASEDTVWEKLCESDFPFVLRFEDHQKKLSQDSRNHYSYLYRNSFSFDFAHQDIMKLNNGFTLERKPDKTIKSSLAKYFQSVDQYRLARATKNGFTIPKTYTFEFLIENISDNKNSIGIGLATRLAHTERPLSDNNGGAYFSDGAIGHSRQFWPFAKPYKKDDIVRVCLDLTNRTITFWLNGEIQGTPYAGLPEVAMFPAVVLSGNGDRVTLNPCVL